MQLQVSDQAGTQHGVGALKVQQPQDVCKYLRHCGENTTGDGVQAASGALKSEGWQLHLVQLALDALEGGPAQDHLPPSGQVGQGLCELHHLSSILHLLGHIVHLPHSYSRSATDTGLRGKLLLCSGW